MTYFLDWRNNYLILLSELILKSILAQAQFRIIAAIKDKKIFGDVEMNQNYVISSLTAESLEKIA